MEFSNEKKITRVYHATHVNRCLPQSAPAAGTAWAITSTLSLPTDACQNQQQQAGRRV